MEDGATTTFDQSTRLRIMAASVGGEIGHAFLERLVASLIDAMDAELVLVTIGEGLPPERARAVFALRGGQPADNIAYDLTGTPCEIVYGGETLVVPSDLARRFPREEGLEGYVGVPVRDEAGRVIGNLVVFSTAPIVAPSVAENIVRIFGARVEAEIRHQRQEEIRERLIADLVRTNQTLRDRSQALHDANQFKTSLLGMIAHDLRNPLAALVSHTELLGTRLTSRAVDLDKSLKNVGKIMDQADRLTAIIEATLARCREDSSRIEIRPRRTDLVALAKVAIETNLQDAVRKNIVVDAPDGADIWAEVDEELCLEAVDNLVSNAIKYSPPGSCVSVTVEGSDDGALIRVRDEGQGMSEEDLARAFRPFQTLSARPTGGETATGLGLANVLSVAEAHGGTATVTSAGLGLGSEFMLALPRKAEARAADQGSA